LCQRVKRGQNRRTKCNGKDKGGERHERAGSYGAVIATTDVLISLYNDWVSIATCRSIPPRQDAEPPRPLSSIGRERA
jgi:hypothetical protein